jgi:hypothetical protein
MDTKDNKIDQAVEAPRNDYLAHLNEQLQTRSHLVSSKSLEKVESILKVLSAPIITMRTLQNLCFYSIPDDFNGLRSMCWKILVGYLPINRVKWQTSLECDRKNYEYYRGIFLKPNTKFPPPEIVKEQEDYMIKEDEENFKARKKVNGTPSKTTDKPESDKTPDKDTQDSVSTTETTNLSNTKSPKKGIVQGSDVDHPLSTAKGSEWNTFFQDMKLWDEIEKDTKRTRNELDFFQKLTNKPMSFCYSKTIRKNDPETHVDVLSRILFIYGKLNPGIGYEGMNEILAPLYYCFCVDKNKLFTEHAEADAFYCFSKLMEAEVKDSFLRKLDQTNHGIQARIKHLNELLKKMDKPLWLHLEKLGVNPQFYSLRWLLLLLTQEFELTDVLRLWDALLSHPNRVDFLNYICLAIIQGVREEILVDDFSTVMETLQKNSTGDLEKILNTAVRLYKQFAKPEEMSYIVFQ